jgi:hypothetical protein
LGLHHTAYTEDSCNKGCHPWEHRFSTNIVGHITATNADTSNTLPTYWPKAMEAIKDMLEYPAAYAGCITAEDRKLYGDSAAMVMTPAKFLVVMRRLRSGQLQRLNYRKTKAGRQAATAGGPTSMDKEAGDGADTQPAAGEGHASLPMEFDRPAVVDDCMTCCCPEPICQRTVQSKGDHETTLLPIPFVQPHIHTLYRPHGLH